MSAEIYQNWPDFATIGGFWADLRCVGPDHPIESIGEGAQE
jgi:hypothetical protein